MLLPFNPINQRLKSPYRVDVGLPRRVSEVNFFHGPLLGYVGMFLKDFFVGQILADSCIDLIEDPEFNGFLFIDLDELASVDGPLESAGQDGEVFPLFFIFNELVEHDRQGFRILLAFLRQFRVPSQTIFPVIFAFSVSGEVDVPLGRNGEVDCVGHDLFCQVAVDLVDFDALSHIDGLDKGKPFILVQSFIDLFIIFDSGPEIVFGLFRGDGLVVEVVQLHLLNVFADYFLVTADRFYPN